MADAIAEASDLKDFTALSPHLPTQEPLVGRELLWILRLKYQVRMVHPVPAIRRALKELDELPILRISP